MRNWLKTLLFVSAFSPVLLSLAIVRFLSEGATVNVIQLATIGMLGSTFPLLIMKSILNSGESFPLKLKKIESNDALLIGFVSSYMVPWLGKASEMSTVAMVAIIGVFGIVLWYMSAIPAHPLLRVFRYRFYKVESESGVVFSLIAKRDILDPKSVTRVKRISLSMLVEG